jgi:A/G-specific adenine glycosylase
MNFSDELINWYLLNKRDLPWRNTNDAYVIWLSEIILQQTRVEQGLPYFHRFVETYPNVAAFAAADEDEILKLWQGLGYYSRGRNMLKTARMVMSMHGGTFPLNYDQLIGLKGIGAYTAAAIASFAANQPHAVVDGNVYRVLARFFGIDTPINSPKGKQVFQQLADQILNKQHPGLHNQAIMEFGAMLCKPKNPVCGDCPVRTGCNAWLNNKIAQLPVKIGKPAVKERFLNYFLIMNGDQILLNKRDDTDIWANMYDLPSVETTCMTPLSHLIVSEKYLQLFGNESNIMQSFDTVKHMLTHQKLFVRFFSLEARHINLEKNWFYTDVKNLKKLALPKIIFIFINNLFNL